MKIRAVVAYTSPKVVLRAHVDAGPVVLMLPEGIALKEKLAPGDKVSVELSLEEES